MRWPEELVVLWGTVCIFSIWYQHNIHEGFCSLSLYNSHSCISPSASYLCGEMLSVLGIDSDILWLIDPFGGGSRLAVEWNVWRKYKIKSCAMPTWKIQPLFCMAVCVPSAKDTTYRNLLWRLLQIVFCEVSFSFYIYLIILPFADYILLYVLLHIATLQNYYMQLKAHLFKY